jgi:putative transposase
LSAVARRGFNSALPSDREALRFSRLCYIEANPVCAGMVTDAGDYRWSSYAAHALGQPDALLSEPPAWSGLAENEALRQAYSR